MSPVHALFDNNVWGPIAAPQHYPSLQTVAISGIRAAISDRRILPYLSQSSLTIEALGREQRIHEYFRACTQFGHPPVKVPQIRCEVIDAALNLGFRVLRVPRLGLPPFVPVDDRHYAEERVYAHDVRIERYSVLRRSFPDDGGLGPLKKLGSEAAAAHGLRSRAHAMARDLGARTDHLPPEEEMEYLRGIVAEFDAQRIVGNDRKKWTRRVRAALAEMADADTVAVNYAYGTDVLCTSDAAGEGGTKGILHPDRRADLEAAHGIRIVSPEALWDSVR